MYRTLARRLERAEASANAAFVEARARSDASVGATWTEIAGAYAMFDGVGSPLTQTFGAGVFDPFLEPEFERTEAFFTERGSSTQHEIASLASEATTRLLPVRGYTLIEQSVVLTRPTITDPAPPVADVKVRAIDASEGERWARIAADGWSSEGVGLSAFVEQLGRVTARARNTYCFLAEVDGVPIAAGALHLTTEVALLAGASTVPRGRRRGAQQALLHARLTFAADRGVPLAMVVTQPSSGSQRNAERQGFQLAYSRTKWERPLQAP